VSTNHERAAREIVSNLGRDRARELLELLEQDALGDTLASAVKGRDEESIAAALGMLSAVVDATVQIAWDEGAYADLDEATQSAMLHMLVEPLRREVGSDQ